MRFVFVESTVYRRAREAMIRPARHQTLHAAPSTAPRDRFNRKTSLRAFASQSLIGLAQSVARHFTCAVCAVGVGFVISHFLIGVRCFGGDVCADDDPEFKSHIGRGGIRRGRKPFGSTFAVSVAVVAFCRFRAMSRHCAQTNPRICVRAASAVL